MSLKRPMPLILVFALLAGIPVVSVLAQDVPVDAVLRDFELTSDYVLEVAGTVQKKARIYQSRPAAAFLVRSSEFPDPVMLSPREGQVQMVSTMSLMMQDDGGVDFLADAMLTPLGSFRLEEGEVYFEVEGKEAVLKPNPPLIGAKTSAELLEHSPSYDQKAKNYKPQTSAIEALKKLDGTVRVRVFFGSWCPFCGDYVPRLIKVQQLLEGSKVSFDYYGLPQPPFTEETEAKALGISGVPTGIVYVNGKEIGRIQQTQWVTPEQTLLQMIQGG